MFKQVVVHRGEREYNVQRFEEAESTFSQVVQEAQGLAERGELTSVDGILVVQTNGKGTPPNGTNKLILRRGI